jgi:hypothetical protein
MLENLPDLTKAFTEAAIGAAEFVKETLHYTAKIFLSHAITGGIIAFVAQQMMSRKLRDGNFRNDNVVISYTDYTPSGTFKKDENGEILGEFYNQEIISDRRFQLEHIYEGEIGKKIVKYLKKASKHVTEDNPVILSALFNELRNNAANDNKPLDIRYLAQKFGSRKIMRERNPIMRENLLGLIKSKWVGFCSEVFNKNSHDLHQPLKDREYREKEDVYCVLVFENGAHRKQFRALVIHGYQLDPDYKLPEKDMVLVDGKHDPTHNQLERLGTMKRVIDLLREDEQLREFCRVNRYTGQILKMAEPA